MKSRIDFESIEISDLELDKAGVEILNQMISILEKLQLFETSNTERYITQAIDISKIVNKCKDLKERYEENIRTNQQIDMFDKTIKSENQC